MLGTFLAFVAILLFIGAVVAKLAGQKYVTTTAALNAAEKLQRRRAMFPLLPENGRVVSIVIPCFNEEERLAPMLHDTIGYFTREAKRTLDSKRVTVGSSDSLSSLPVLMDPSEMVDAFEIIVVDDCSRDGTVAVAKRAFAEALAHAAAEGRPLTAAAGASVPFVSVVESKPNHGKGYAVRRGFFEAIGDYVLMADGDNATQIADATKLLKAVTTSGKAPFDIAVGSRAHLEHESIAQRTLSRSVLMVAFHLVVNVTYAAATLGSLCVIRDTQCGFKLFHRERCEGIFKSNRLERWAFDVELLVLARRQRLRTVEVCVNWAEVPGSKVRLSGMVQMGLECLLMCFTYPLGFWSVYTESAGSGGESAAEKKHK